MTRMGRPGEFFDQDEEGPRPAAPRAPEHSGRGMLYDQDVLVDPTPPEISTAARARQQRVLDRQRERDLELRREAEFQRERDARRRRARAGQPGSTDQPLRISSRPGFSTSTVIVHPPSPAPEPPPTPKAWPEPRRPADAGSEAAATG